MLLIFGARFFLFSWARSIFMSVLSRLLNACSFKKWRSCRDWTARLSRSRMSRWAIHWFHSIIQTFFVDTAENRPSKVAPLEIAEIAKRQGPTRCTLHGKALGVMYRIKCIARARESAERGTRQRLSRSSNKRWRPFSRCNRFGHLTPTLRDQPVMRYRQGTALARDGNAGGSTL